MEGMKATIASKMLRKLNEDRINKWPVLNCAADKCLALYIYIIQ